MSFTLEIAFHQDGFDLSVDMTLPDRGTTVLLGPSGAGKTTLLRVVAGLERPDRGRIVDGDTVWFDAQLGVHWPPQKRRVGLVFQDYALFDHLSVADNVGFGLPKTGRAVIVADWLRRMRLEDFATAYPRQLSGGQRQRVALARALAVRPDVLLLDEPFAALDIGLRRHLRDELQAVIKGLEIPVLMVTHDLEEARYLADRVGVMVDGALVRLGSNAEVFDQPLNVRAAGALGWRNLLPVDTVEGGRVSGPWGGLAFPGVAAGTRWLAMRPERVGITAGQGLPATVSHSVDLGAYRLVECRLADGSPFEIALPWDAPVPKNGEMIQLDLPREHIRELTD